MRGDPQRTSFIAGEIDPLFHGDPNSVYYKNGVEYLKNYLCTPNGLLRRKGSYYERTCVSTGTTRLMAFPTSFSHSNPNLFFELSDLSLKITGAVSQTVTMPYPASTLYQVHVTQVGDMFIFCHAAYAPRKLKYNGTDFTLYRYADANPNAGEALGPYLPTNTLDDYSKSTVTITPGATSGGSVTMTASAALFTADWAGRCMRLLDAAGNWIPIHLGTFNSSTVMNSCRILFPSFVSTAACSIWQQGVYSDGRGFPFCSAVIQGRLAFSGTPKYPDRVDFSSVGEFNESTGFARQGFSVAWGFEPSAPNSQTVRDVDSFSINIGGDVLSVPRWMKPDERGLLCGSDAAEILLEINGDLKPSNPPTVRTFGDYGGGYPKAEKVSQSTFFVPRSRKSIKEALYDSAVGRMKVNDASKHCEHILVPSKTTEYTSASVVGTNNGIQELQKGVDPYPYLTAQLTDGNFISALLSDTQDGKLLGCSRIILAGNYKASEAPKIVGACVVKGYPKADGSQNSDEIALVVRRTVNGTVVQYIEVIRDPNPEREFYLDCAISFDSPFRITGITKANPAVVTTSASHGFSNGDVVKFSTIIGMTQLSGVSATIANVTATTFELSGVNSSAYGTFVERSDTGIAAPDVNTVRKKVTSVTGLTHLNGETVDVVADGAYVGQKTVSGNAITLDTAAALVHVGYSFNSDIKLLRNDVGSVLGTAFGKTQRTHRCAVYVNRTVNIKIGKDFSSLESMRPSASTDEFSGILSKNINCEYELGNRICVRQDSPVSPGRILGIMPMVKTEDRQ